MDVCLSIDIVLVCCQTFHTPSFGDEEFDTSASASVERSTRHSETEVIDDVQFVDSPVGEEDVENIATLFMSCSPGRDTEDDEDEDDSLPLSKVCGITTVSNTCLPLLAYYYHTVKSALMLMRCANASV